MKSPDRPANKIFISYRRDDSTAMTGRIYDCLIQRFGRRLVFKDVDSTPLGVDFRKRLDATISACKVVLVVIGDRWAEGLDDPRDFVRAEIELALRLDIRVVPLLVQNAKMPMEESLPASIRELSSRHGMTIGHDQHFYSDVQRLISELEEALGYSRTRRSLRRIYSMYYGLVWAIIGSLLMAMIFGFFFLIGDWRDLAKRLSLYPKETSIERR